MSVQKVAGLSTTTLMILITRHGKAWVAEGFDDERKASREATLTMADMRARGMSSAEVGEIMDVPYQKVNGRVYNVVSALKRMEAKRDKDVKWWKSS